MEGIVVKWFKEARAVNVPVNDRILREKSLKIANRLIRLKYFTASNSWIGRNQKSDNLVYRSLSGESSSVDESTIEERKKNLQNLIKVYKPKDVFSVGETGLFLTSYTIKVTLLKETPALEGRCPNSVLRIYCALILMKVRS